VPIAATASGLLAISNPGLYLALGMGPDVLGATVPELGLAIHDDQDFGALRAPSARLWPIEVGRLSSPPVPR
jgi:hypothetical protein